MSLKEIVDPSFDEVTKHCKLRITKRGAFCIDARFFRAVQWKTAKVSFFQYQNNPKYWYLQLDGKIPSEHSRAGNFLFKSEILANAILNSIGLKNYNYVEFYISTFPSGFVDQGEFFEIDTLNPILK